jgi:predicted DNA-binding WGR domain protein
MKRFIRIKPESNMFRYYQVQIMPDLFGGWNVVREWGRIGSPGATSIDHRATLDDAWAELDAIARLRKKRGYLQVSK